MIFAAYLLLYPIFQPSKVLSPTLSCPVAKEKMDRKRRFEALLHGAERLVLRSAIRPSKSFNIILDICVRARGDPKRSSFYDIKLVMECALSDAPLFIL